MWAVSSLCQSQLKTLSLMCGISCEWSSCTSRNGQNIFLSGTTDFWIKNFCKLKLFTQKTISFCSHPAVTAINISDSSEIYHVVFNSQSLECFIDECFIDLSSLYNTELDHSHFFYGFVHGFPYFLKIFTLH